MVEAELEQAQSEEVRHGAGSGAVVLAPRPEHEDGDAEEQRAADDHEEDVVEQGLHGAVERHRHEQDVLVEVEQLEYVQEGERQQDRHQVGGEEVELDDAVEAVEDLGRL